MYEPRWSSGTVHGSSAKVQPMWAALANAGVEIVVSGDEHVYERFAPMDANGNKVVHGLRQITAGTGGRGHYTFGNIVANSEVRDNTSFGVLKLTLNASSYDWRFLPVAGGTFTDSGSTPCH
jgi:hypothetical protein